MPIIRVNKYCLIIGFIWLLYERIFYLIPQAIGPLLVTDIANILLLLFGVFELIKFGVPKSWDSYHILSVWLIGLTLVATIMSSIYFGQSVIASICPQRYLIIAAIAYFAIHQLIRKGRISSNQLYNMLVKLGKMYLVLFMFEYVLSFVNITIMTCEIRVTNGSSRYYVEGTIFIIVLFHEIVRIFNDKVRLSSIAWIAMTAIYFFIMCQTRMIIIGILVAIGVYFLTWKSTMSKKIMVSVFLIISLIAVWNTTVFQDTINISSSSRNTMDIRQSGIIFYLNQLKKSPIFGFGFPNSTLADISRGKKLGYLLNDDGLFGLMYMYGLLGLAWIIVLFVTLLRKSWIVKKHTNQEALFLFSIYTIAVCGSLTHWYWIRSTCFLMVLVWVILQDQSTKTLERRYYE